LLRHEYRATAPVDSSPGRWFIELLHFTRLGECTLRLSNRF
jgi:hypothetical protein